MFRTLRAAALVLAGLGGTAASAEHYMQTADPQVVGMINQVVGMYRQACQMGHQTGCQLERMAMSEGHYLLSTGYNCMANGNQQDCGYYQQAVVGLQNNVMQMQQTQLGSAGMGNPLGATHGERMQNIHNWGESRMEWGQQQSAIMDQRHEQFMQTLRE